MSERSTDAIYKSWVPGLFIALLGVAAYSNSWQVPFLLDDSWRIVHNDSIITLWPITSAIMDSNRPAVNVTFALNYALHGLDLWGYHVLNLLIHIGAGLCLFGWIRRTLERRERSESERVVGLAFLIAAIWVVHPLQTSAVTYINQRFESLMGLAFLATFYAFVRGVDASNPRWWFIVSFLTCSFGMLCKEDMVAAPLLVLWFDRALIASSWKEILVQRWLYYLGIGASWLGLVWAMTHYTEEYVQGGMIWVDGLTPWTYLLTQSEVIVHYLKLSIWPKGLCFVYDWQVVESLQQVWPQFLFLACLLLTTIVCLFRNPPLGFVGGWFFLILAPTSSFIPIMDLAFEHRMYLPLVSVVALFVLGLDRTLKYVATSLNAQRLLFVLSGGSIAIALTVLTYQRNYDYRTELALWQATLEQGDQNAKAWQGIGCIMVERGDMAEACVCFEKAARFAPKVAKHKFNYGNALYEMGELVEGEKFLLEALAISPNDTHTLRSLGNMMLDLGQNESSLDYCQRASRAAPRDSESRMSLVAVLITIGRQEEAIEQCQECLRRDSMYFKANLNMANALTRLGRVNEAIEQCEAATRSAPNQAQAFEMLGSLQMDGHPELAVVSYRHALELEPDSLDRMRMYSKVLAKALPHEAIEPIRGFLESYSDDIELRFQLVIALATLKELDSAIVEMEKILQLRPQSEAAKEYMKRLQAARRLSPVP